MKRLIMHVDMDAFFASVEQRDNPAYRGKPVIVGGLSGRGVVSACSYEARQFGVHSAMPMVTAQRLCPQGIFVPGRMRHYQEISEQIMRIFREFSPNIEPLSVDEAFLDLTGMEKIIGDPAEWGLQIKARIKEVTGLTASVGIAPNKFLAKLASDLRKPDGLVSIPAEEAAAFIAPLTVRKIFGIGEEAELRLKRLGVEKIGELAVLDFAVLGPIFGKNAATVQALARGVDNREVESERDIKSIGREETFLRDLTREEERLKILLSLTEQVGWRLRRRVLAAHTVTVKVKFASFRTLTRSYTNEVALSTDEELWRLVKKLAQAIKWSEPVRLLGVTTSKFAYGNEEVLPIFVEDKRQQARNATLDKLKSKFGEEIIKRGNLREE